MTCTYATVNSISLATPGYENNIGCGPIATALLRLLRENSQEIPDWFLDLPEVVSAPPTPTLTPSGAQAVSKTGTRRLEDKTLTELLRMRGTLLGKVNKQARNRVNKAITKLQAVKTSAPAHGRDSELKLTDRSVRKQKSYIHQKSNKRRKHTHVRSHGTNQNRTKRNRLNNW